MVKGKKQKKEKRAVLTKPDGIHTHPANIRVFADDKDGNYTVIAYDDLDKFSSEDITAITCENLGIKLSPTYQKKFIKKIEKTKNSDSPANFNFDWPEKLISKLYVQYSPEITLKVYGRKPFSPCAPGRKKKRKTKKK
jgi:hypothetical protein